MIVCVGRMFFVSEIFKHFCNLKILLPLSVMLLCTFDDMQIMRKQNQRKSKKEKLFQERKLFISQL